jgi:hypothetical protein
MVEHLGAAATENWLQALVNNKSAYMCQGWLQLHSTIS